MENDNDFDQPEDAPEEADGLEDDEDEEDISPSEQRALEVPSEELGPRKRARKE